MVKKVSRRIVKVVITIFCLNLLLAAINYVPTETSESDAFVFRSILKLEQQNGVLSYSQEIDLIKKVQHHLSFLVRVGEPIPEYKSREPFDLVKQGSGLCYDRSRLNDKIFSWLGFRTRHVYILYSEDPSTGARLSFMGALFRRGIASHAVTEVKTQRGWVLIDSTSEWISVAKDDDPVDADHIPEAEHQFTTIPGYFVNRPYWAIRGLYSRRGHLYRPYFIMYPQANWFDLFSWLIFG